LQTRSLRSGMHFATWLTKMDGSKKKSPRSSPRDFLRNSLRGGSKPLRTFPRFGASTRSGGHSTRHQYSLRPTSPARSSSGPAVHRTGRAIGSLALFCLACSGGESLRPGAGRDVKGVLGAAVLVRAQVVQQTAAAAHSDDPQYFSGLGRCRLVCAPRADNHRAAFDRIHDRAGVPVGSVTQRCRVCEQPVRVRRPQREQVGHFQTPRTCRRPEHAAGTS